MKRSSRPRLAACWEGAEPKYTVRATLRAAWNRPEVGVVPVEAQRQSAGAVDVGLHDGAPGRVEVSDQFLGHVAVVDRDRAGHDQQAGIAVDPQRMDDRGHEPQHPPGALEPLQCGPFAEEPVEQFGMHRVGGLHAALVVALAALRREIPPPGLVERGEGSHDRVTPTGGIRLHVFEQTTPPRSRSSPQRWPVRQLACVRANRFSKRVSAACPLSPPTSICDEGMVAASSAPGVAAAASVRA